MLGRFSPVGGAGTGIRWYVWVLPVRFFYVIDVRGGDLKKSYPRLFFGLLLLMLATPLVVRAGYVDLYIQKFTGAWLFGAAQVMANDAVIYAVILGLFYLSFLKKMPRAGAVLLRVMGFVLFGVYAVDVVVLISFNMHLTPEDVFDYAGYAPNYIAQISRKRDVLILASSLPAVVFAVWVVFSRTTLEHRACHATATLVIAGLLVASLFTSNERYIGAYMYRNLIAYNLEVRSESRAYSDAFLEEFSYQEAWRSEPKEAERPSIVVLMVESLSSYQSDYFSGLNDWTPNLDRIAGESTAFTSYYANGFCTNDFYIAFLTGRAPARPPASSRFKRRAPFAGHENVEVTLPRLLTQRGYATDFILAGDLAFGEVGPWIDTLGFSHVEGHDHPYYDGCERLHFDSAPDEALFGRVLQRIKEHGDNRFFMMASTLTTHHPFVNPEDGQKSEEKTIRYSDKQLGIFYDQLVESGFFNNGVLIILGDHHTMIPLKPGETERFGRDRAAAAVPMLISYGDGIKAVVDDLYSHVDVFNSLRNLTSDTRQTSDWAGDIFQQTPPNYTFHRRGDYRDNVSVFTKAGDYRVKLDGDETRVINKEGVIAAMRRELAGRVNAARIR